jgi:putative nucleotidyltransferase-like protein
LRSRDAAWIEKRARVDARGRGCDTAEVKSEPNSPTDLWDAVDRLIDLAPQLSDIQSHRIGLLAARRWRATKREVPPQLLEDERRAQLAALMAPLVLERVRAAYDGPILLVKGPAIAARYPDPSLRWFKDLDLIVEDAEDVQKALANSGAEEVGDPEIFVDIHHLRPLRWPDLPLPVEIHSRPKWVEPLIAPSVPDLLSHARPGAAGILVPSPGAHAILLAAHSWAHEPLRRLGDVIDIAALIEGADRNELAELARSWKIERVWSTTLAALDAVLYRGPTPLTLQIWARNLSTVRERTVLEDHLRRWLSDFSALPRRTAVRRLSSTLANELGRDPGETWRSKLLRSMHALRNAKSRKSEHDTELAGSDHAPRSRVKRD